MQPLKQLMNRLRAWLQRARGTTPVPEQAPAFDVSIPVERLLLREVTAQGVRVYSLCGSCGTHLAASATLCGACAVRRTTSGS